MLKFENNDIPQDVFLDCLAFEAVEDYTYVGATTVKGITIDLYIDTVLRASTRSFWLIGCDANVTTEDGYAPVFEMPLSRKTVGGVVCWHPDYTQVDSAYQGLGIMAHVYITAMKLLNIKLMAGTSQSPGAVKLWARIARKRSIKAFAFNRTYGWAPVFIKNKEMATRSEFDVYDNSTCRVVVSA